jgi:hypothetical protein
MTRWELASDGVTVRRVGRTKRLAWLMLGFFAALFLLSPVIESAPMLIAGFIGAAASLFAVLGLHFGQPLSDPRRMKAGAVAIDDASVTVTIDGRETRFPREIVTQGWIEPMIGLWTVVLRMANDDLVALWTRDVESARAALRAAGVAADQQAFRMRLSSAAAARPAARILGLVMLATVAPCATINALARLADFNSGVISLAVLGVVAYAVYRVVQFLAPPWVVVGTDGVGIEGVGKRKFVPFSRVRGVTRDLRGVYLRLDDETEIALPTFVHGEAAREVLLARIEDARTASASESLGAKLELLDRNGRPFTEWVASLRELLQGAGYRHVALDRDELVHAVEDAKNPPERRIAAAVALAKTADVEARKRVRIAVQACAEEGLRAALDAAIEDQLAEEEVVRATKRVEASPPLK